MREAPELTPADAAIWNSCSGEEALLPLYGSLSRFRLVGGGGAGKSRIINRVFTPLLEGFYGRRGLMKETPSNKAARNINGEILHCASILMGNSALLTPHLRPKPRHMPFLRGMGRLVRKIFDEFSLNNSRLFHTDAYCTATARAAAQADSQQATGLRVDPARYAEMQHSWGTVPVAVIGGDELQFPCVPSCAGLLAPIEGTSNEQKTAVNIFSGFDEVYRLTAAMRFDDPVLIAVFVKMRKKGGSRSLPPSGRL